VSDTERLRKLLSDIDDLTDMASKRADVAEDMVGELPETVTDNIETLRQDMEEIHGEIASVQQNLKYAVEELERFEE
jgi:predicted  nucleic acid-binding Zn-ribbon protein